MMEQITLSLESQTDYSRESYFVSESNREAFEMVERWPEWPSNCLVIYGPESCGKTHLANIWKKKSGAIIFSGDILYAENFIVENLESVTNWESLFHLYNNVKEQKGYLLITSSKHSQYLDISLKDLSSRLNSAYSIEIKKPDDELFAKYIRKLFSDRQLRIGEEVISYLVTHINRSFADALNFVDKIDKNSLAEKRNITVPLIKSLI